jgi:phenylacetate-coenzyme A ligase PaaK-like adenylate-forming protein
MSPSDLVHSALIRAVAPERVRLLRLIKRHEAWGRERIRIYQEERLREVIRYCWDHVPFYQRHWARHLSDPRDIRTIEDLAHLPPVTRELFQQHAPEFVTTDPSVKSTEARTGGSTGAPIVYRSTRHDDEFGWAQLYNGWTWAGWRPGEPFLVVGGESIGVGLSDKRTWRDWVVNRWATSGSNITLERTRYLVQSPQFSRITFVCGYPNSIRELCECLAELGARPPRLRGVVCTAEVMMPEVRERISAVLGGVPVLDQWGLNDGAQHACEGPDQDGLHVSFHRGILEIVDDADRPITELHRSGRGLATSLLNTATPFVRYETGDQVHWHSWDPAPCGIAWPRIGQVDGRWGDVIYLSTGRSIPMPGLTLVMRWMDGLRRYQFIQTGPDAVTVRLDRGPTFGLSEDDTKRFLRQRIADEVNWTVEWGPPELTQSRKVLVIRNDWLRRQGLTRPPRNVSTR